MSERNCPDCGSVAADRLKFCRECGARLPEGEPEAPVTPEELDVGRTAVTGPDGLDALVRADAAALPSGPADDEDEGDATIMSGAVKAAAEAVERADGEDLPSGPATDDDEDEGDATIMSGAVSEAAQAVGGGAPPLDVETRIHEVPAFADDDDEDAPTFIDDEPSPSVGPVSDDEEDDTGAHEAPPPALTAEEERAAAEVDFGVGGGFDDGGDATLMSPAPRAPDPVASGEIEGLDLEDPDDVGGAIRLEHWSPGRKPRPVVFENEEGFVGREDGEATYPSDHYLSRRHARFYRDDDGHLVVEDLGTLNGVFLRVRQPIALQHRDVLQVGRHVMRFELLHNEEEDPRTIEGDPYTEVMGVQGSPPIARLVKVQEEGFTGTPFYFGTRKYVLGRTEGSHRFTRDDRMSRRHCELRYVEGDFVLEDLGSQNGTFLRIHGPRRLDTGDVVKLGDQYFGVV